MQPRSPLRVGVATLASVARGTSLANDEPKRSDHQNHGAEAKLRRAYGVITEVAGDRA